MPISRIAVWKFFCKLLSNYLWRSLYIVKFHDFSIFFWTPLEGFVWSMRIILWDASYFRHSNNIHTARASLQNLLMELQWKWRLQVLFRQKKNKNERFQIFLDKTCTLTLILRARFSACSIGRTSKIAPPKKRAHKILQRWIPFKSKSRKNFQTLIPL